ncbi:unnamed protein product, partial [Choristocarpus tenellus]
SSQHKQDGHNLKSDTQKIRGYMDLLDEYSLHHFIIWYGKVIDQTPEFLSLRRKHQAIWNSISRYVTILEEVMSQNRVPLAVIDGKQLAELALFDLEGTDKEDLCRCIANLEQIRPLLRNMEVIPRHYSLEHKAATSIQAAVRAYIQRCSFLLLKRIHRDAIQLQRAGRAYMSRRTAKLLLAQRRQHFESIWESLQQGLRSDWDSWRGKQRVIIHVPSLGVDEHTRMGDSAFHVRQNLQISRICSLMDPQVYVVYVSPFVLSTEIVEYHKKILELAGIERPGKRLTVVVPEHVDVFPSNLPLASLLLYSPGCLRRIKHIIKGQPAVIISGVVGWQEKRLAVALGTPLLSAEPTIANLLCTQSGMKRVFEAADVNIPLGAHDIYSEDDFMVALTKLIASNLNVQRWKIKIDACHENQAMALFDTTSISCMEGLHRERAQLIQRQGGSPAVWHHPDVQLLARARLLKCLNSCLHHTIIILDRTAYPTWTAFIRQITRTGCVIEAEPVQAIGHPSASLFVAPTGQVTVIATMSSLYGDGNECVGFLYPQTCVPSKALEGATLAIGKELFKRGVMGYCNIKYVAFWDSQSSTARLWATDLELGLSGSICSFFLFCALTDGGGSAKDFGCFHNIKKKYTLETLSELHYAYLDYVHQTGLGTIQLAAFFKLCRLEGISFDLCSQVGTIFNLVDTLVSGVVGMLTVASSKQAVLLKALNGLKFIKKIVSLLYFQVCSMSNSIVFEIFC